MSNYKEMYLKVIRATELALREMEKNAENLDAAMDILIQAQIDAEEAFISEENIV